MTLGQANVSVPVATLLAGALQVNVLLAVFNLIPIPPLDGGNVVSGLLPIALARPFNAIRPYGFLVIYALMLSGILQHLIVPPYRLVVSWLPTR